MSSKSELIECKAENCSTSRVAENGGSRFLARNIFGPLGHKLTDGYCDRCQKRNLARGWLGLVALISIAICIIELPWKGPLFAMAVIGFWTIALWNTAFGE